MQHTNKDLVTARKVRTIVKRWYEISANVDILKARIWRVKVNKDENLVLVSSYRYHPETKCFDVNGMAYLDIYDLDTGHHKDCMCF